MNLVKNQKDDLNIELTLTVAADDYAPIKKKKLNEYKKNAEFKGFRKGMAPMGMIEKIYGGQALGDAINSIIDEQLNKFISENKLNILGEPISSEDQKEIDWKEGNDFEFKFDLGLSPEISFEPSKEDKVPSYKIEVSDAAKAEFKENLLRQYGKLEEGETVGEEDYVIADFVSEEKTVEGVYVAVRSVATSEKKKFVGKKAGSKFKLNVNKAFTNETDRAAMLKVKKEELETINPDFNVTIVNVKTFVPAEANQETFDKIYGEGKVKSAEEFEKAVEEQLEANYKQESEYRLGKDIKAELLKKADVKLPEEFLKRWLVKANDGKFSKEEIEKEFAGFAEDFKWQLLRGKLSKKYEIKIEQKDLNEAAEAYVSYQYAMYGMGNVPEAMIKEAAQRILTDERQARQLIENIEDQKVIDAVKKVVTLQSKKTTVEKFRELK
ncbi:MAG: trigger factor [Bacteroidales bacterium]|nr:trigger factor [Bacteroidales bacterium]